MLCTYIYVLCIIVGYEVCKLLKISESKQAIVSSKTFNAALVSKKLFHKRTFEMEIHCINVTGVKEC